MKIQSVAASVDEKMHRQIIFSSEANKKCEEK